MIVGHLPQEASVARSRPQVRNGLGRVRQASAHRPTRGARRKRRRHALSPRQRVRAGWAANGRRGTGMMELPTVQAVVGCPPRPRPVPLTAAGSGVSRSAGRKQGRYAPSPRRSPGRAGQPTAGAGPVCSDSRQPGRWLVTDGRGQERPVVGIGGCPTRRNRREPGPWDVRTQRRSDADWTSSGWHDAGLVKQSTTRPVAR